MTHQNETTIQELDLQHLDHVVGGEDQDLLLGGGGRDLLLGGAGDDLLIGGETTFSVASSGYIRVKKLNTGG